ncbi:hypothetical protein DPMN_166526 [Dreissena polymorpha]|uniref:Uncharacterized protein n=1 Tax=Dreissena polymorpha TaxID=45954 RepID=A0A9D4F2Q2_DREPO|nr:hypothetical protein DPMN_166526 [Dreissena polymorpha]
MFYRRPVLSYSLILASAFTPLPDGPDGWFYHRPVLSYSLMLTFPSLTSKAGLMVGYTVDPSCLILSSSLPPSLPSRRT